MQVKVNGIPKLEKKLKENCTMNDVKVVVRMNGALLQKTMQRHASPSVAFKKGYSHGDTKSSIKAPEISADGMSAKVGPTTKYAPYVEYGTRFMEAEPFVRPAYMEVHRKFIEDLKKLMR